MSEQVIHLDFISLNPSTGIDQRKQLEEAASGLLLLDQVISAGLIDGSAGADFDMAFWFLLPGFAALEPFGTHPEYARFLQGSVAPVLRGFAGADVKLQEDFDSVDGPSACLALAAPEETYDFEVRERLETWAEGAAKSAVGLAVGEKQLYRGVALAFGGDGGLEKPEGGSFIATLIRGDGRLLG